MKAEQFKAIVESRNYEKMVGFGSYPEPGRYIITGPQVGNLNGEGPGGWSRYLGYIAQVRRRAGAFGSDLVLVRHPQGELVSHENQSFYYLDEAAEEKLKELFDEGVTPEKMEDYRQAYSLNGEYPEVGQVIEEKESDRPLPESPLVKITTTLDDGSKTQIIV